MLTKNGFSSSDFSSLAPFVQPGLRFNGGGHINHSIFWKNLSPNGGGKPSGSLANAINTEFGSFEEFKAKFSATTVAVQGSGWGWLAFNPNTKKLQILACPNQDPLEGTTGLFVFRAIFSVYIVSFSKFILLRGNLLLHPYGLSLRKITCIVVKGQRTSTLEMLLDSADHLPY